MLSDGFDGDLFDIIHIPLFFGVYIILYLELSVTLLSDLTIFLKNFMVLRFFNCARGAGGSKCNLAEDSAK